MPVNQRRALYMPVNQRRRALYMPVNLLGYRTRHPGWGWWDYHRKNLFVYREKSEAGPNVRQAPSVSYSRSAATCVLCGKAGKIIFENDLIVNGSKRTAPLIWFSWVGFRSDLRWWDTFLQSWNGISVTGPHPSHAGIHNFGRIRQLGLRVLLFWEPLVSATMALLVGYSSYITAKELLPMHCVVGQILVWG